MSEDLISREYITGKICGLYSNGKHANNKDKVINEVIDIIDNAPTVDISGSEYFPYRTAYFNGVKDGRATTKPQGKCKACDYYKLAQSYINGIVEIINKYGLTVDELLEILKTGGGATYEK